MKSQKIKTIESLESFKLRNVDLEILNSISGYKTQGEISGSAWAIDGTDTKFDASYFGMPADGQDFKGSITVDGNTRDGEYRYSGGFFGKGWY